MKKALIFPTLDTFKSLKTLYAINQIALAHPLKTPNNIKMDSSGNIYFKNQLLIAMPHLADPNFSHSVTYICEHNRYGAMGIVINLASTATLGDVFDQLNISHASPKLAQQAVLAGGPVQINRGFILHKPKGNWEGSLETGDGIYLTVSKDVIEAIANNEGPDEFIIALGYAGWAAGQLEEELAQNSWLTAPVDENILFHLPYESRWQATAKAIGVDINLLATQPGHA